MMPRLIGLGKCLLLASAAAFVVLTVLTGIGVILIILNGGRV